MKDGKSMSPTNEKEVAHYRSFIRAIPLFCDFPNACIDKLLDNANTKHYRKQQSLFLTGDDADHFYLIVSGWIKLFRETRDGHETVVAMLTNGDIFGRSAVLKNGSYPYSAEASTDCEVIRITSEFMLYMAEHHQHFDHFLAKFLEGGLNDFDQKGLEAEHLAKMTSAERVGCFLLKMCGNTCEGSITLDFPYEKSLVAGRLGMTPETFSRSLNQLSAIGVETKRNRVVIHNVQQLQSHICGKCSAIRSECIRAIEPV
jgi:CRP-like cAMP-binding protein